MINLIDNQDGTFTIQEISFTPQGGKRTEDTPPLTMDEAVNQLYALNKNKGADIRRIDQEYTILRQALSDEQTQIDTHLQTLGAGSFLALESSKISKFLNGKWILFNGKAGVDIVIENLTLEDSSAKAGVIAVTGDNTIEIQNYFEQAVTLEIDNQGNISGSQGELSITMRRTS